MRGPRRRDALVERSLPLVCQLARRHQQGSEPLDDLVQVASLAPLRGHRPLRSRAHHRVLVVRRSDHPRRTQAAFLRSDGPVRVHAATRTRLPRPSRTRSIPAGAPPSLTPRRWRARDRRTRSDVALQAKPASGSLHIQSRAVSGRSASPRARGECRYLRALRVPTGPADEGSGTLRETDRSGHGSASPARRPCSTNSGRVRDMPHVRRAGFQAPTRARPCSSYPKRLRGLDESLTACLA